MTRHGEYVKVNRVPLRVLLALGLVLGALSALPARAGEGQDGDAACDPPDVPVRKAIWLTNNSGEDANDLHFYMYQCDRPAVVVNGATAGSDGFDDVDVELDSWNNHPNPDKEVPPGVGPPYHGAQVEMSGGEVKKGQSVKVELMLCMNEQNSLKLTNIEWTNDGAPIPAPPVPAGGWRVKPPIPGGVGGIPASVDPGGLGYGAQEDNGGTGSYIHIVCIENHDRVNSMLLKELKLLASMTYYDDIEDIDWDSIDPIKTEWNEPPVLIPPLGKWCYNFETTGAYMAGHVYLKYEAEAVPPPSKDGSQDEGGDVITLGDHPNPVLSEDVDSDGLWDSYEDVWDLDREDDGSTNPDNGPAGDPDVDLFDNLSEQTLGSNPTDPTRPPSITPGFEILRSLPGSIWWDFSTKPIPADFFGPGSDPFDGIIAFHAGPLAATPCGPNINGEDLVFHCMDPVALPDVPSRGTGRAQMTPMNLMSTGPIAVSFEGGLYTFEYEVALMLEPQIDVWGLLEVSKTHGNGGTFSMGLPLTPTFHFTPLGPHEARILPGDGYEDMVVAEGVPWKHMDGDLDCPDCTTNFIPGVGQEGTLVAFLLKGQFLQMSAELACPAAPAPTPLAITEGLDLWSATGPLLIDFGTSLPPLPAGFFGPGSEPFEGQVRLTGLPIGLSPSCPEPLGNASALIERQGSVELGPPPAAGTVPVEMVGLSLMSTEPIEPVPDSFFDVFVEISTSAPSTGSIALRRDHEQGGYCTVDVYVYPKITFSKVGDPGTQVSYDLGAEGRPLRLLATHVPWIDDSMGVMWPVSCSSNFVPGIETIGGGKAFGERKVPLTFNTRVGTWTFFAGDLSPDNEPDGLSDFDEAGYGTNPLIPDSDTDGLNDGPEVYTSGTDPMDPDSDNDGLLDGEEVLTYFTDPLDPDTDFDGLTDGDEVNTYSTEPDDDDTDDDGLYDGEEVLEYTTDPKDADSDNDGLTDGVEVKTHDTDPKDRDSDNDGLDDGEEITETTDPNDADSDDDGVPDGQEVFAGTDPKSDLSMPDVAAYLNAFDTDGATLYDLVSRLYLAADLDNDLLPDRYSVGLVAYVLVDQDHSLHDAVEGAYLANLAALREEANYESDLAAIEEILAAILLISQDLSDSWAATLGLTGTYASTQVSKDEHEPFSGEGDLDGDGNSNVTEYNNVMSSSGDIEEFIEAASDPGSNGLTMPLGIASLALLMAGAGALVVRRRVTLTR
ncbi:MAG TPA: hypothetical protein PLO37_24580 [Candidatus Hydrogenedentes bacterium]|nr:hypothetical protein [Candidatus Hydrogenedentota bacterium]HPG70038.1 hypothetical protein [Candidatus Hydrogenedentota bacterium]